MKLTSNNEVIKMRSVKTLVRLGCRSLVSYVHPVVLLLLLA